MRFDRSGLLWGLAVLLTLAAGVYQRVTGPTYPVRGSVTIGTTEIPYRIARSHAGPGDHEVRIAVPDDGWEGTLSYRRYPTDEPWSQVPLSYRDGHLTGGLPHQPPAGKVAYQVILREAGSAARATPIPPEGPLVLRFRGDVPIWIVVPHVLVMFLAMLWSNRAGMEALRGSGRLARMSWWSLGLMILGGLVFGPVMQWFAFGKLWTGFPLGTDLTDTKTLVACLAWLAAVIAIRRGGSHGRWWVLGAALVTLVVFLIPHSVLGSELDYSAAASNRG